MRGLESTPYWIAANRDHSATDAVHANGPALLVGGIVMGSVQRPDRNQKEIYKKRYIYHMGSSSVHRSLYDPCDPIKSTNSEKSVI